MKNKTRQLESQLNITQLESGVLEYALGNIEDISDLIISIIDKFKIIAKDPAEIIEVTDKINRSFIYFRFDFHYKSKKMSDSEIKNLITELLNEYVLRLLMLPNDRAKESTDSKENKGTE